MKNLDYDKKYNFYYKIVRINGSVIKEITVLIKIEVDVSSSSRLYVIASTNVRSAEGIAASRTVTLNCNPEMANRDVTKKATSGKNSSFMIVEKVIKNLSEVIDEKSREIPNEIMINGTTPAPRYSKVSERTEPIGILAKLNIIPNIIAHNGGNKTILRMAFLMFPPNFKISTNESRRNSIDVEMSQKIARTRPSFPKIPKQIG